MSWLTLDCDRALYVHEGRDIILCDRLPTPVKLVVKLAASGTSGSAQDAQRLDPQGAGPTAEGGDAQGLSA